MTKNVFEEILDYVTSSSLPLSLADPAMDDTPLIAVSNGFCKLTGHERATILGKNCRFLQGTETTREQRTAFRLTIKLNEQAEHRITNYVKDGRRFDNLVTLFPFVEPQSGRTLFCASQYDISRPMQLLKNFDEDRTHMGVQSAALRWDNAQAIIQSRRQMADLVQRQIAAKIVRLGLPTR